MSKNSEYLLRNVNGFLKPSMGDDLTLVMPTVRHFDCVCNNYKVNHSRSYAAAILLRYFTHSELLINVTAFDKFAKLQNADSVFANEIMEEMLNKNDGYLNAEAAAIESKINALPPQKQGFYTISAGRKKIKITNNGSFAQGIERADDPELDEVDKMIKAHENRLSFVGKVKKMREGAK